MPDSLSYNTPAGPEAITQLDTMVAAELTDKLTANHDKKNISDFSYKQSAQRSVGLKLATTICKIFVLFLKRIFQHILSSLCFFGYWLFIDNNVYITVLVAHIIRHTRRGNV